MGKNIDILVVDDEQGYHDLFTYMLEPLGIHVTCACNGKEALERVEGKAYDLILMDFQFRDLEGHKICDMIRTDDKLKHIPIFMITGHRELNEAYLKAYGATEVVYKPIDRNDLLAKINKYLL